MNQPLHQALASVKDAVAAAGREDLEGSPQGKSQILQAAARLQLWIEMNDIVLKEVEFHSGRHWGEAKKRQSWTPPPLLVYSGATRSGPRVELWAYVVQ